MENNFIEICIGAIIWIALCCLAGNIAEKKGRSYSGFFWLSLFIGPIMGIIIAFIVRPSIPKGEE